MKANHNPGTVLLLVACTLWGALAMPRHAHGAEPPRAPEASGASAGAAPSEAWQPPPPAPDEFDWIQLNSGEWLKGKIEYMERDVLTFESDELDTLELDMEDIKYVRSPGTNIASFDDRTNAVGKLEITKDTVRIVGAETREVPRDWLLGLTPGAPKEINYWSFKASAGLNVQTGNTEQSSFAAKARVTRRTPNNRFGLDYLGNIGSVSGAQTVNNHRVSSAFDIFINRRLFVRTPMAEYFRDPFQNIAHRGTFGAAVGYTMIDRKKLEWEVAAGPGYQYTVFESVEPGTSRTVSTPALLIGTRLEKELNSRTDLTFEYRGFALNEQSGQFSHHTVLALEFELTDALDLDLSGVWDRMEKPRRTSTGETPLKDDFYLMLTFGLDI